jgi:hypothetical protein
MGLLRARTVRFVAGDDDDRRVKRPHGAGTLHELSPGV